MSTPEEDELPRRSELRRSDWREGLACEDLAPVEVTVAEVAEHPARRQCIWT